MTAHDPDPFDTLRSSRAYNAAVHTALTSDAAALIRHLIADALVDLLEDGEPTNDYTRGYRMGLRVAYLRATVPNDVPQDWGSVEGTA